MLDEHSLCSVSLYQDSWSMSLNILRIFTDTGTMKTKTENPYYSPRSLINLRYLAGCSLHFAILTPNRKRVNISHWILLGEYYFGNTISRIVFREFRPGTFNVHRTAWMIFEGVRLHDANISQFIFQWRITQPTACWTGYFQNQNLYPNFRFRTKIDHSSW